MQNLWLSDLIDQISRKVTLISKVWAEMGVQDDKLKIRMDALSSHLLSMLNDMYNEEITAKQTIITSIKDLKEKILEIEEELQLIPSDMTDAESLILTEKNLYDRHKVLCEKVSSVIEVYEDMKSEEERLCVRLNEPASSIKFKHAPSADQIRSLKLSIDFYTQEKRLRLLELSGLKQDITHLHPLIGHQPNIDNNLIDQVLSPNSLDRLPLSRQFLFDVNETKTKLERKFLEIDEKCKDLKDEIKSLEYRLDIPDDCAFDITQISSANFLSELESELNRLKEMRLKNLSLIIENCRNELVYWWDRCFLAECDRCLDLISMDNEYSEKFLGELESEINKWKTYYTSHEDIFKSIEAWQCLLSRYREIEQKMKDPTVLKNRGGILLIVEKQYKQVRRDIKRQESMVLDLSNQYPAVLIHGLSIPEFLQLSWSRYEEEKLDEAKQKQDMQRILKEKQQNQLGPKKLGVANKRQLDVKKTGTSAKTNSSKKARLSALTTDTSSVKSSSTSSSSSSRPRPQPTTPSWNKLASSIRTPISKLVPNSQTPSSRFGTITHKNDSRKLESHLPRPRRSPRLMESHLAHQLHTSRLPMDSFRSPIGEPLKLNLKSGGLTSTPRPSKI